jgi:hypothetical protein
MDESHYTIDDGYFAVRVNEPVWQNYPRRASWQFGQP